MNEVLPKYGNPCLSETRDSLESAWLYPSDFGECYPPPSDELCYPRLVPVYNGKVLDIQAEFVHASLSGISIKHYNGRCAKETEEEDIDDSLLYQHPAGEDYDFDWSDDPNQAYPYSYRNSITEKMPPSMDSITSGSFEYREDVYVEGQPLCTVPNINYRNSFWNIHRPELCKLTWGQNYVGISTVTEHLHEHLVKHGRLCAGFHTEEDRKFMLNKELDEYVRLKVVQEVKKLPPDEPLFDFRPQPTIAKALSNPKCKNAETVELKTVITNNDRFLQVSDDEEEEDGDGCGCTRGVRRSKGEFCLTIGRHIRKPPVTQPEPIIPEEYITPELSFYGEEEAAGLFYYNWLLYTEEEPYEEEPDDKGVDSTSMTLSELEPLVEPCQPLMMDEFCRAAGKVDFSDLRCNPDF